VDWPITSSCCPRHSPPVHPMAVLYTLVEPEMNAEDESVREHTANTHCAVREAHATTRWHLPRRHAILVSGLTTLGTAAILGLCMFRNSGEKMNSTASLNTATIQESSEASAIPLMAKILAEMTRGIHDGAKISEEMGESYEDAKRIFGSVKHSMHEFKKLGSELVDDLGRPARLSLALKEQLHNLTSTQKKQLRQQLLKQLNLTSLHDLSPVGDGETCGKDEELHDGLCYKRCSLLTDDREPFRASAFQCCDRTPPCDLGGSSISMVPCSGNAVGGEISGNGCPHRPGGCLHDEELLSDMCYMQCSLLTYGMLKHRNTANACCKSKSPLAMLELGGCDVDAKYAVGGGKSDGNPDTPAAPHPPVTAKAPETAQQM